MIIENINEQDDNEFYIEKIVPLFVYYSKIEKHETRYKLKISLVYYGRTCEIKFVYNIDGKTQNDKFTSRFYIFNENIVNYTSNLDLSEIEKMSKMKLYNKYNDEYLDLADVLNIFFS